MEQERIDWTKNLIVRLLDAKIGDKKKLEAIQNILANNFTLEKKESKYLQKLYEELEKHEKKLQSKICLRCKSSLGFLKHKSKNYWGYQGNLCGTCFDHLRANCSFITGKYIEGTLRVKSGEGILLYLNNFDAGSLVITTKSSLNYYLIEKLKKAHSIHMETNSFTQKIISVGKNVKKTSEFIEIEFDNGENSKDRIVLKIKDVLQMVSNVNHLKQLCEVRGYKETISSYQPSIPKQKKIDENISQKHGQIIKETPSGQYNGGHKAPEPKNNDENPLKILKLRLAKGEITKEEFEELKGLID